MGGGTLSEGLEDENLMQINATQICEGGGAEQAT